ncbi:MAG TPA: tetratricopeptide repeat protein, partial [Verrucomicrobiales bacterium]|nr:tetratricopeptide repeat protein [Verrucomicrobiales bacterium]
STPADAAGWSRLGEERMLRYRQTLDVRYVSEAREAFEKAAGLDPDSADALVGLAWAANTAHVFGEGIRWARMALEKDPDNDRAEALLGDAAVELGRYDEAFEHYQRALDLRPGLSSYSRASHLLFLTGDTRRAIWMMQKAIEAGDPAGEETAWCRAQWAEMLFETGALLPAAAAAEAGLMLNPEHPSLLMTMGRIRLAQGRAEEAEACYRKALDAGETHEALAGLGDLLWATGRRETAEEVYQRLIAFHGAEPGSAKGPVHGPAGEHGQLARFYADHDRNPEDALDMAQPDYDAFPNVRAADTLAWCLYRNGRFQDALRLIRRALSQGTQDAGMHYHAGLIQIALGNVAEGKKHLYQALNLNPHFDPIHAPLAVALLGKAVSELSPGESGKEAAE